MDITCSAEPCPIILNATCVFYEGNTLVYTGINTNDNLQTALQKIDQKFQDAGLGYIFTNGIEQLTPGGAVMLGGALIQNTTIGGSYNLAFAGTLEASALITTGGTSSDFVKGDGSLDPTSYQPAGNYISNLTGDVTANGPGSVTATLATVFGAPGTYGNSGSVPSITVDGKGRITNVTPIPINYPAQSLSFVGDVEGLGFTGSPVTLTLDTVNTDIYGSNNFLKFAVNGKGLITSATPVSGGDITTVLGYVPVDNAIELTINGVAHDLTANRDWEVGTVTTVGVVAGLGISASVSNPSTTPVINIVNTAPDQTVRLNAGFGISISGSYPNFTITNDYPDLPEKVTSFSSGNLVPLFTTSVATPTTTPALSFALANAAANTVFAGPDGGAGTPTYRALVAADIPSLAYISNISVSAPLATTGGLTPTISISQANASTDGYLSSTDWNTFNGKQPAGNYITALTGDAIASGPGSACLTFNTVNATTGTFGSSTQVPVITVNGKGLVTCVTTSNISGSLEFIGDVTGTGSTGTCTTLTLATVNNDVYASETLLNIAVNGKGLITSANPTTAGDICSTLGYTPENVANKSTATSLGTSNTLYPTQLAVKTYVDSATAGGIILQGDWDAATNTPNISGTTTTGWAWRVSVQGTTNLGGINDWHVGDLAVKSATGWVKIDNTENVTSVFGRFGTVIATVGDYLTCQVTECSNLYYTDARVRAAIGHTAPLTYNSTTGVFGITQSNTTTDGYLSATDWTTFNDKQPALGYTPVNQTRQLTINGTSYDLSADRSWSVGTVTSVTASAPLASSGGNTPNLTITQAGVASNGFLSSADWNTFNSKTTCLGTVTSVATCTSTTGVLLSGSPITSSGTLGINISTASTACTGLLSAADWNTFNSHTSCSGTVTSVGLISSTAGISIGSTPITTSGNISLNIATASSICTGLLSSSDWNSFNSRTSCTGTVTSVNATGTNISVSGGPITTSGSLAISLSGANVCSALGYTPYNATNPNGYTTCIGTVTSVGVVATNINVCNSPVTTSGNICLNLTAANVCSALGFSPAPSSALSSYLPLAGGTMSGILCSTYNTSSGRANLSFDVSSSVLGNIHIQNGAGPGGSANQAAITFMGSVSNNAQAGIYVLNDNSNGTSMGFATTGSYAAGPQLFMTASNNGVVNFPRANPTVQGNQILNAGNYNSYSPTLTGGGASGTWSITATGNALVNGNTSNTFGVLQVQYAPTNFNPSAGPRNIDSMSIKMWNNYFNGTGLGSDYGTVMQYYSLGGHVDSQVYFDAGGGSWYRTAAYASGYGAWQHYLTSSNYTNYAPSLTGGGASGTWGINVTGTAGSETLATVTSRGNTTPSDVTFGSNSTSDQGIRINYGNYVSGYGRIRFMQDSSNHSTIHSFSAGWQSGTLQSSSSGAINLDGQNGVTIGPWNNPSVWVDNGGIAQARSSFRAPIFYDSNDTTYYLDPNSTGTSLNIAGSVNAANFNKPGLLVNSSGTGSAGSAMAIQQVTSEGWTGIFVDYEPNTGWGLYHDNPANYFLITSESATGAIGSGFTVPSRSSGNRTAYVKHRFDQNNGEFLAGGMILSYASVRAPIFYDSNDTTYYGDFASNSRFNGTVTNTSYFGADTNKGYANGYGTYSAQLHKIARITFDWDSNYDAENHGIFSTSLSGGYSDNMSINSYNDINLRIDSNDNNSDSYVRFHMHTTGNSQFAYIGYNGSNYEAYFTGIVYGGSSMRSPIFYDSDDTTYYLDPNADLSLRVYGEICNSNYQAGALQPGALNIGRIDTNYRWDGTTWASDIRLGILANCNEFWELAIHDSGDSVHSGLYYDGGTTFYIGRNIGWGTCSLIVGGDVTAYSDISVKENIRTIDNALDKTLALRGTYFNRTDTKDTRTKVGFIAQEVQQVVPELVSEMEDGLLGVSYGNAVALLVEAIKEQQKQIEHLKSQLDGITK